MISVFHLIGNIAVWVALTAAVTFCGLYATVARWRASAEGWHLMAFTAVIAAAFGWIAYRLIVPPGTGQWDQVVRAALLSSLAALLIWRLLLLVRAQIRRRRR